MTIKERLYYYDEFSSEAMVLHVPCGACFAYLFFRAGTLGFLPGFSLFFFSPFIFLRTKNTHTLTHTHTHEREREREREREKETCYHRIGVRPYHYIDDEERARIISPVRILLLIFFIFFED